MNELKDARAELEDLEREMEALKVRRKELRDRIISLEARGNTEEE